MVAVLVVDLQNAFFENPTLDACKESLTLSCNRIIAAAQESGSKVLLVKTAHERDKST